MPLNRLYLNRRWCCHLEVPGRPPGLRPLELVVELGDVGEDGEAVGRVARGHVLGVQQRRDAQLLLGHPERKGARPARKKREVDFEISPVPSLKKLISKVKELGSRGNSIGYQDAR